MAHHAALDLRDLWRSGHRIEKRAAQETVLDHVAHRAFLDLRMVEFQHEGRRPLSRAPVGDLDLEDRLRMPGDRSPDTKRLQEPLGREGERVAPPVEAGFLPQAGRRRVHQHDREPAEARARASEVPFSPPPAMRTSASTVMLRNMRWARPLSMRHRGGSLNAAWEGRRR
jgi:hypothetical protein